MYVFFRNNLHPIFFITNVIPPHISSDVFELTSDHPADVTVEASINSFRPHVTERMRRRIVAIGNQTASPRVEDTQYRRCDHY